jgi:hypothetical protein
MTPGVAALGLKKDLSEAVILGSVLLFDGWYAHPGNDVVIEIYQTARSRGICSHRTLGTAV